MTTTTKRDERDELHFVALAVDDSSVDLTILCHHLDRIPDWQVEVHTFTEPSAALRAFEAGRFDIVLLDYHLGPCTGVELFRELERAGNRAPAILMTGQGDERVAVEALRAGVSDYLPKGSLSDSSLRRSIDNVVQKYRMEQALEASHADLERTVAELREKNREIQSFYHTLSHELKTPLTGAREFVSLTLDGVAGPLNEEQLDFLRTAKRCCDEMVRCINDMLDVSRIETGKLSLHRRATSVEGLVARIEGYWRSAAEREELRFETRVLPDLPDVLVDEERTIQVLNNLLSNALKFTDAGGSISLSAATDPGDEALVEVSVTDTGRGIEPEELSAVFDRLYQVSEEDAALQGGLGLGLNLVRELVRLHGGQIRVESEPGKGSTFTFTLPVAAPAARSGDQGVS